ncbi:MAG: hypothetical protein P8J50_15750 [Acidimicrobiales bacterium]|jgi:hypothetical protein|nr:hypothetical protein [Acidimicrobiales bacterium]
MADHPTTPDVVFHYSEQADIVRFVPHVPPTQPDQPPLVWAIDREHAPACWFPRDCPRATWWTPGGVRIHAVDVTWEACLDLAVLHEYELPGASFSSWSGAEGYMVSSEAVRPRARRALPSARDLHAAAGALDPTDGE